MTKDSKLLLQAYLRDQHLELTPDATFVRWMRDNPKNPRNWPVIRKAYDIVLICLLDLFV